MILCSFEDFCSEYTVEFSILLSLRWIPDFPGHHNIECWQPTLMPNMHSETGFAFHFCCVLCDSQVAMESFSKHMVSLWVQAKVYEKLRRHSHWYSWSCSICCTWGAIHAHHFCNSRKCWSHLPFILICIKCKENGVSKLPRIYYVVGCKSRWQAQQMHCIPVLLGCHFPLPLQGK